MVDGELQQDHAFAGIAVFRAGVEMDAQLLVGFQEGEVGEARRMGQDHARRDLLPARIVGEILVRAVFVGLGGIGSVARQGIVEIGGQWRVELEPVLVDQLQDGEGEDRLGQGGAVHDGVGLQRITLGVADAVGLDVLHAAVVDQGDRQALGMGLGEDLVGFGVDSRGHRKGGERERQGDGGQHGVSGEARIR